MPQVSPVHPAPARAEAPEPAPLPDLAALRAAWRARRPAADPAEEHALEALVSAVWRSQRLAALELRLLEALLAGEASGPLPSLTTLVRYGDRLERARRAAELELERLRREPRPAPATNAPAAPEPAVPDSRGEACREAEHTAPEPPVELAPAAADRAEAKAPEPPRGAVATKGGGSQRGAPEPHGPAADPPTTALSGAGPLASATSALRVAGRLSTSSVGLLVGLDAAGAPLPVLPPFAASAGRARAQRA
jgi:hypothetical protein